jgi:hypothetical protein
VEEARRLHLQPRERAAMASGAGVVEEAALRSIPLRLAPGRAATVAMDS